jgi:ribosome-binding protein aMBF1 (putative translation factor)
MKKEPSARPARGKRPAPRSAEAQASALRKTRHEHAMETAQDYVEAIADLDATRGEARAVDLARRLGVSHVTVIRTVARLARDSVERHELTVGELCTILQLTVDPNVLGGMLIYGLARSYFGHIAPVPYEATALRI